MDRCLLRAVVVGISIMMLPLSMYAQDLGLSQNDLRIELWPDGGYHLFIRYKPDISSVLLTETTRDPLFRADNYAYRAAERNPINGNEIRLLDGYPISPENRIYSLVSSTPQWHPDLGWAYHIYIPDTVYYGYEGGRHGEVQVGDGTYLNIRTFYYAYADYRGAFRDNPFMLQVAQQSLPPETAADTYMPETVAAFTEIAGENTLFSDGSFSMVEQMRDIFTKEQDNDLDVVICLDTTGSMKPYVEAMRLQLARIVQEITAQFPSFRIGMVLFKDYYDVYLTKVIPFTNNLDIFQKSLNAIKTGGGGDIPEAVYEGLHAGATQAKWAEDSKKVMILVGDAPPHPRPRGKITKQMVDREIAEREIKMYAIVLPEHTANP